MANNEDNEITIFGRTRVELKNQPVEIVTDGYKRNPNSLRFLIAHIVQMFYGGNRSIAAKAIGQREGRYISERRDRGLKRMNYDALSDILKDEQHITYWQLELIANEIKIPVGALLIFSRLYKYIQTGQTGEDGRPNQARNLAEAVKKFGEALEKIEEKKTFSKMDFIEFADIFKEIDPHDDLFHSGLIKKGK